MLYKYDLYGLPFLDSDSLYNYADPSYRYRDDLMSLTLNYDEKTASKLYIGVSLLIYQKHTIIIIKLRIKSIE